MKTAKDILDWRFDGMVTEQKYTAEDDARVVQRLSRALALLDEQEKGKNMSVTFWTITLAAVLVALVGSVVVACWVGYR